MEDLEAVTERLKSAEEAHRREIDEQQRRTNNLQERLVETRGQKEEVSICSTSFCVLSVQQCGHDNVKVVTVEKYMETIFLARSDTWSDLYPGIT